ncbi:MAG TPA: hypothetical protein VKA84_07405 [Gemmatimonadaceae bacterium]|nr:hypothetical protein [Gemmatimonadaceae bacterium]
MTHLTTIKIVLAVVGLLVFGYGVSQDDNRARIIGIVIVGVGAVLRFVGPRPPRDTPEG